MDKVDDFKINSPRWLSLENFEGEVWKDVIGYEELYQVSNLGRVKTKYNKVLYTKPIIILKQSKGNNNYLKVGLTKNGKCSHFSVHRLVAAAFLPNKQNFPCINHKDENKTNNKVSNLEWCSYLYNNNYGTIKARISATHKIKAYNGKAIVFFDKEGNFLSEFPSIRGAERFMPISRISLKRYKEGILIGDYIFFHKAYYSKEKLEKIVQNAKDFMVVQLTKDGDFVKCYNNIKEAANATGVKYSQILWCCKHVPKFKTGGGYVWIYNKEYTNNIKSTTDIQRCIIKNNARRKKVYQFDLDGKYISTYASVREATKITHISTSAICEVCNEIGNFVTAGNYIWTYTMDMYDIQRKIERAKTTCKKKIIQRSIDGDYIATFSSIKEASEATGVSRTLISQCVCKRLKKGGCYKWEYSI